MTGATAGPPVVGADPTGHGDPPECCPADVPCANGAFLMARCMLGRSPAREPILAVRREDLGELGESPSVPEQGRGFFRTHRMRRA
jgi:hypothetical protein